MFTIDPYQVQPASLAPQPRALTIDDIEARRKRLKAMGANDTALGQVNDFAGGVVQARDDFRNSVRSSLLDSVGGKSIAKDTATKAMASQGMAAAGAAL